MKKYQCLEQQMLNAIPAASKSMIVQQTSKDIQVPHMTLSNKIHSKAPNNRVKESVTVLPNEDEINLVRWMLNADAAGFPITKSQLLDSVQKIVRDRELKTCFVNGRPGKQWHESFLNRHPELLERNSSNTFPIKSDLSQQNIQDWFQNIYKYLDSINMHNILKIDNRVFTCEESTFFLNHEEKWNMMIKREEKTVYNVDERERMTAVLLANAAGVLAPPLVVSKSQRLSKLVKDSIPQGWEVGRSENGWATSENFLDYIVKVFYPWLMSERIQLPIILFLDAIASPLTFSLSEFCQRYGVVLVALYPNNNYVPRPLDVAFYHSLKEEWKDVVIKTGKSTKGMKREDFCPLFKEVLGKIDTKKLITTGFKNCGLFPFNIEGYNYPQFLNTKKSSAELNENDRIKKSNLLRGLEEIIGDKFILFENCKGKWNGCVEDTSLFELWLQLKKDSGEMKEFNTEQLIIKEEPTVDCENYDTEFADCVNMDIIKPE